MKITVIVGSLRHESLNKMLAENLARLARADDDMMEITFANIGDLPLFNQDLESDFPVAAKNLKHQVETADGILVATPEYNRGLPGVLKNAIDWTSRPSGENSWPGKPVAIVGATPGLLGTALAQTDLRRILAFLNAKIFAGELYLANANKLFDGKGDVVSTEENYLREYIATFREFIAQTNAEATIS